MEVAAHQCSWYHDPTYRQADCRCPQKRRARGQGLRCGRWRLRPDDGRRRREGSGCECGGQCRRPRFTAQSGQGWTEGRDSGIAASGLHNSSSCSATCHISRCAAVVRCLGDAASRVSTGGPLAARRNADNDRLRRGRYAAAHSVAKGHKRIGLRKISGRVSAREVVWNRAKGSHRALLASVVAGNVHQLLRRQSALLHVFGIQKYHSPAIANAAIAVVIAIDGGIELVMAPDGRQHQLLGFHWQRLDLTYSEFRLATGGAELALLRRNRRVESALTQAFIE